MKKILALVVAMLLVAGMVSALAAAPVDVSDTYPIKVEISDITTGNTLNLYKIVTFKLDSTTNEIDYELASGLPENYNTVGELGAIENDGYVFRVGSDAKACADTLAKLIADGTVTPLDTVQVVAANDEVTINSLPAGWYIATVSGTANTSYIYQNMIINAMPLVDSANNTYAKNNDASFQVKHTTDTITKGVGDDPNHEADVDKTDKYSVGDDVPYEIKTNIPNYPNPALVATFKITDTPTSLTDDVDSIAVNVNGNTIDACEDLTATGATFTKAASGDGFVITFAHDFLLAHATEPVIVNYTAKIKEDAVITDEGLTATNTAKITFNPNPNEEAIKEPDDTTEDYTYGLVVRKHDGADDTQALKGAKFELWTGTIDENDNTKVVKGDTKVRGETEITRDDGRLSWNGLEAGVYALVETKAPAGYRLDSTPRLVVLNKDTAKGDNPITDATETYYLTKEVPNEQGSTLPSTGGIGTTLFYVGGGILVLAAIILLVTKKRMSSND